MDKLSAAMVKIISAWEKEQSQVWRTKEANDVTERMLAGYITAMLVPIGDRGLESLTELAVSTSTTLYMAVH
jgi:hypothetical protein